MKSISEIRLTGPDLFDLQRAQDEREEAIDRVGLHQSDWLKLALGAIEAVSAGAGEVQGRFTSDDVLRYDLRLEGCPEKRVLGAAFRKLRLEGIIEPTGRYISSRRTISHARPKREWRRAEGVRL